MVRDRRHGGDAAGLLVAAVQEMSRARSVPAIQRVVRTAARRMTGADGATFVLRDGDTCFYADEDAIQPLWKGQRFPLSACVSGWAMLNREHLLPLPEQLAHAEEVTRRFRERVGSKIKVYFVVPDYYEQRRNP